MKAIFLTIGMISLTFNSYSKAIVCSPSGDYCKEVVKVFNGESWEIACCYNVHIPEGNSCADDCHVARIHSPNSVDMPSVDAGNVKKADVASSKLTPLNAYVKFSLGYRVWVIIDGVPVDAPFREDISVEVLRTFLPTAREVFISNDNTIQIEYSFDDKTSIVVERPSEKVNLEKEIVFRDWGIEEDKMSDDFALKLENSLLIYPNPIKDKVNIKMPNNRDIRKIQIMNNSGEMMHEVSFVRDVNDMYYFKIVGLRSKQYYFMRIEDIKGRVYTRQFTVD